ncbi:MAG: hypothetical protein M1823_005198 [Watsoniomyces obsoletus]|nr:MAG: hypothetical protein M1823_005198 [Watsoniomyces obsoletus]
MTRLRFGPTSIPIIIYNHVTATTFLPRQPPPSIAGDTTGKGSKRPMEITPIQDYQQEYPLAAHTRTGTASQPTGALHAEHEPQTPNAAANAAMAEDVNIDGGKVRPRSVTLLGESLPHGKKLTALEEAEFEEDVDDDGGFQRERMQQDTARHTATKHHWAGGAQ